MRMRRLGENPYAAFVVTGMEGEDRYQVLCRWSADGREYIGYEIYAIDGCYAMIGCVNNQGGYVPYGQQQEETMKQIQDPLLREIVLYCRGKVGECMCLNAG